MSEYQRPRLIRAADVVGTFDCGVPALNEWLGRHAVAATKAGTSRVFVVEGDRVRIVAYYALATSTIDHAEATTKVGRGMPRHPIPAALITRLAVSIDHQGKGLGGQVLRDAMFRVANAADLIGIRALHVHAKTPEARAFYERYGFEQSPVDELHLQLTIKTIRASYAASQH